MDNNTKDIMFATGNTERSTPQDFFDQLNDEFHFTIDVAASTDNAKCAQYYDKDDNALRHNWYHEVCWLNPPYNRNVGEWIQKAIDSAGHGATTVMLLPARTDTKWFHDLIIPNVAEIRFVRGRLHFDNEKAGAPFPSMVVVFRPGVRKLYMTHYTGGDYEMVGLG